MYHCPWYVPQCYTPQCQDRSLPRVDNHGGACFVLPMVYVFCESPHGMFLVCVISWCQPYGGPPLSRNGAYICTYIHICIYIYAHICTHICTHILYTHLYIYISYLHRWGCIFPGMSFADSRKALCLSECSASGGPNPVAPQSCRAILNPATATEDVCWSLGQGWIDAPRLWEKVEQSQVIEVDI